MRIVLVISIVFFCSCKQQYDLSLHPSAGSSYRMQMHSSSDISRKLPQRNIHTVTSTEMTLDIFVDDEGSNKNADKKLRLQFVSIASKQLADSMHIEMSSKLVDSTDPTSIIMNQMIGVDFVVTMRSDGKVLEVKGKDALFSKVVSSVKNTDTLMRSQLIASMKTFMTDEIIANLLEQGFFVFPAKPVAIGSTWNRDVSIAKPMPMNIFNEYTLEKVTGDEATLSSAGTITPGKQEGKSVMGYVVKTELNGVQNGTLILNSKTGMPVSNTIEQQINGRMISMGHSAPITMHTTVQYNVAKIK